MKLSQKYSIAGEMTDELDLAPIQSAPFSKMMTAEGLVTSRGEIIAIIESDFAFLHTFIGLALDIPEADLLELDIYDDTLLINAVNAALNAQASTDGYIVKLAEPFAWKHKEKSSAMEYEREETITEIDMSGVKDLKSIDVCNAQRAITATQQNCVAPMVDTRCLMLLASKATGKPLSFFKALPAGVGNAVKMLVKQRFFTPRVSQPQTQPDSSDD